MAWCFMVRCPESSRELDAGRRGVVSHFTCNYLANFELHENTVPYSTRDQADILISVCALSWVSNPSPWCFHYRTLQVALRVELQELRYPPSPPPPPQLLTASLQKGPGPAGFTSLNYISSGLGLQQHKGWRLCKLLSQTALHCSLPEGLFCKKKRSS